MSKKVQGDLSTKLAEFMLYVKEHKSLAPQEVIRHSYTGLTTKISFADDSHVQEIWSEEMIFLFMNKILDVFGSSSEYTLGIFKSKTEYGPVDRDIDILFFPFKRKHNWHLAVGFQKKKKIVLVDCSPKGKSLVDGFPLRTVIDLEDYILKMGVKLTKSSLSKPIKFENLFSKTSNIQAINVLAVIYTCCCKTKSFCDGVLENEKLIFDISQFSQYIDSIDRYSASREIFGNLIDVMEQKSVEPEISILNSNAPLEMLKYNEEVAKTAKLNSDTEKPTELTMHQQNYFPRKAAKLFIREIAQNLQQFPDNIAVIDEFIEMIEHWGHYDLAKGEVSSDLSTWDILTREVIEVNKDSRNRMVFDEEEVEEILKVDHHNQIFPLIVENGLIYLVNFHTEDGFHATIKILCIMDKAHYNVKRDSIKQTTVKRLAEFYCFRYKRLVTDIQFKRYTIDSFSVYNLITTMLFFVHSFNITKSFDLNQQVSELDVINYGIAFQSLMHAIYDNNVINVEKYFKRLNAVLTNSLA